MADSIKIDDALPCAGINDAEPKGDPQHSAPLEPCACNATMKADLSAALDILSAEIEALNRKPHHRKTKRDRRREALRFLLLNLLKAWQRFDPEMELKTGWTRPYVAYPRKAEVYSHDPMLTKWHISYRAMIWAADGLLALGYAEGVKGWKHKHGHGRGFRSRIRATPRLMHLLIARRIEHTGVTSANSNELIVMKDKPVKVRNSRGVLKKFKPVVDISDRTETAALSPPVREINKMLKATNVELHMTRSECARLIIHNNRKERTIFTPMPSPRHNQARRKFNNNCFEHGGRFYGHWVQNLPKWLRKGHLTINGKPTVERDFVAYHITILYHRRGLQMPDNTPYNLPGWPTDQNTRAAIKRTVNTLINAEDRDAALKSILFGADSLAEQFGLTSKGVNKMIDAILTKHAAVADDLAGTDSERALPGWNSNSLTAKLRKASCSDSGPRAFPACRCTTPSSSQTSTLRPCRRP